MMGGTGKTPFLKWLISSSTNAEEILISSRGYKSKSEKEGLLVNTETELDATIIGDENYEILKNEKSVSISIGRNRVELIKKALSRKSYKYIFLDDGFQHLKINRDLNIVLFSSLTPTKLMKVAPSGYMREGLASLFEADIVIMTNCQKLERSRNEQKMMAKIAPYLAPGTPIFRARTILKSFCRLENGENASIDDFGDRRQVNVVCGIAGPEKFTQLLEVNDFYIEEKLFFRDHQKFSNADYKRINEIISSNTYPLLITEKDAGKIDASRVNRECFICSTTLDFFGDDKNLLDKVYQ